MSEEARDTGNGVDYFAACPACGAPRHPDQLPIPRDIKPDPSWTGQMLEMSDFIGPYATVLMVKAFGGQRIYIPADHLRGKRYRGIGTIVDVIGEDAAAELSKIYRREYVWLPKGKAVMARARRAPFLAAIRAGLMSATLAARILGTSRTYMSHLVNATDEGTAVEPAPPQSPA